MNIMIEMHIKRRARREGGGIGRQYDGAFRKSQMVE